jgi:hypothetical protein
MENELKCAVSGSFDKAKSEIDKVIDEFTDLGVTVLAPDKGWLYKPPTRIYQPNIHRSLPSEIGMSPRQIEDSFLDAVRNSDFLYVIAPSGYVGTMVAIEIGAAITCGVPVYSQEQISSYLDPDPIWKERLQTFVKVMSPSEAVEDYKNF